RVGSFLLDGVLGREHEKRLAQKERLSADRHLLLLHRLEQRRLDLGGGAVDLVREHQVREQRPLLRIELLGLLVEHHGPDHVRGQQVRRELDSGERDAKAFGHRAHRQRLGEPGHAFEQDVPARQQADEQALDHQVLRHDPLCHLARDRLAEHRVAGLRRPSGHFNPASAALRTAGSLSLLWSSNSPRASGRAICRNPSTAAARTVALRRCIMPPGSAYRARTSSASRAPSRPIARSNSACTPSSASCSTRRTSTVEEVGSPAAATARSAALRTAPRYGARRSTGAAMNASKTSPMDSDASAATAVTTASRSSGGTRASPSRCTKRSTKPRSESATAAWSIACTTFGSFAVGSRRSSAAIASATMATSCNPNSWGASAASFSTAAACSSGVAAFPSAVTARFTSTSTGNTFGRNAALARF